MEHVNFHLLLSHLYANHLSLAQSQNLQFSHQPTENLHHDQLVISHPTFFTTYHFATTPHLWDNFRQFTISTPQSGQFHFRINPIDHTLIRYTPPNSPQPTSIWNFASMNIPSIPLQPLELPNDLAQFGEQILNFINTLEQRYRHDTHVQRMMTS